MKKIIVVLIMILCSCKMPKRNSQSFMDLSVVRDPTDLHLLQPDPVQVLSLFNLSEDKSAGVGFRYSEVSDKILASLRIIRLRDASITNDKNQGSNPIYREK